MTRPEVDEYLAQYRECVGRAGYLEITIKVKEAYLESKMRNLVVDAALETPQHEEGMPHGSGVGNPVERIVLKYADGFIPDELRQVAENIQNMKTELWEKNRVIICVEAWMKGLSEREAWIINHKVIDSEYSWREVIMMYRLQYGEEYSRDALKRMKDRAMEKIYGYAA